MSTQRFLTPLFLPPEFNQELQDFFRDLGHLEQAVSPPEERPALPSEFGDPQISFSSEQASFIVPIAREQSRDSKPPLDHELRVPRSVDGGQDGALAESGQPVWFNFLSPPEEPGSLGRLGKYDILSLVARGGMGVVFRARQRNLRRIVALKMIRDASLSSPAAVQRLRNEAEAAARLQHKNIVRIHEFGEIGGLHYYSMEFVEGRTLEEVMGGNPLWAEQAARYAETIAVAIHYAHQQGVLHRDLKPANIMIDESDCVRITDFGLAKQLDAQYSMTETGQILGTARYMSPEQAAAKQAAVGPGCDVYSIGAILYEMLTGRAPFLGETPWEILRRVCEEEPIPLRQIQSTVPKDIESICLRCLQKNPQQRYASAGDLARDLRRFRTDKPVIARPIGVAQRLARWAARNRVVSAMSSAILVLGCVVLGLMWPSEIPVIPPVEPQIVQVPNGGPEGADNELDKDAGGTQPPGNQGQEIAIIVPPEPPGQIPMAQEIGVQDPPIALPPELDDPLYWLKLKDLKVAEAPRATVTAKAIAGKPFGVGEVTISFDPKSLPVLKPDDPVWITEKNQRVLYPAIKIYRDLGDRTLSVTVRFLFQGTDKLDLVATAIGDYPITVKPELGKPITDDIAAWWQIYTRPSENSVEELAGHDMLRSYLSHMLSRRLNLKLPTKPAPANNTFGALNGTEDFLHLLLGTASIRVAMQKEVLLEVPERLEQPTLPLPKALELPAVAIPEFKAAPVELLAAHVPEECFYVRCTALDDWKWFGRSLSAWGGNLGELVSQRGLDQGIRRRLEQQLALSQESAADLFANGNIAEFALIGSDTFYHEGAAIGVVFRANDTAALRGSLERQRRSLARVMPQAQLGTTKIDGHDVSYFMTTDNSVRSFYAIDGDVHFVTTSRHLVERFYEAGKGRRDLASLQAFQYARSKFPLKRDDAVFIYMSDPFFVNFLSPHYRIEMTRRARALAALELAQMSRWAAIAERQPSASIAELVTTGLLPAAIQSRPEGGEIMLANGQPIDSLRGAAGTFMPIPDMPVSMATASEVTAYRRFTSNYFDSWTKMDPVIIALYHRPSPQPGREQILCDVNISPLSQGLYGGGNPYLAMAINALRTTESSVPAPKGSVVHASVAFNLKDLLPDMDVPLHIFAGALDLPEDFSGSLAQGVVWPQKAIPNTSYWGTLDKESMAKAISWYLGDSKIIQPFTVLGYHYHDNLPFIGNLWCRGWDNWFAIAEHRETLEQVTPLLKFVHADRPAQIRVTVADLEGTRWGEFTRMSLFAQARQLSAANPRLLQELMQQLHLEAGEARPLAEELLRGKLVCPLGGDYVPVSAPGIPTRWVSTAWREANLVDVNAVPRHHQVPFLHWFHGLQVETTIEQDTLTVHFELETSPEGADILQTEALTEALARKKLELVIQEPIIDRRQTAFHLWVIEFQNTALVEKVKEVLPEMWEQREEEATLQLAAIPQPPNEADRKQFTPEAAARERAATEEWDRLPATLPDLPLDKQLMALDEFAARWKGTDAARKATKEALRLRTEFFHAK